MCTCSSIHVPGTGSWAKMRALGDFLIECGLGDAGGIHRGIIRWTTIRQYAGFSTAEVQRLLPQRWPPAQGVSVALTSRPTAATTRPSARGRRRRQGRRGDRLGRGHEDPLRRHPLDKISVSMTMNGAVLPGAGRLRRRRRGAGRAGTKLSGTIQNDILKGVHGPEHLHLPARAVDAHHRRHHRLHGAAMPKFNSISISGYHIREAGATATGTGLHARRRAWSTCAPPSLRAWTCDDFAGGSFVLLGIGMNFFMEVAKMRAARLLWHGS